MKKFKVFISESAQKTLTSLDSKIATAIKSRLKELEDDPYMSRPKADIKRLHGMEEPSMFRLRIGDYRAIYFIEGNDVKVTEIIHRGKGYDWLD